MPNDQCLIGRLGEDAAQQFLIDLGYQILHRNMRLPSAELDLVALSPDGVLVFVEVKTDRIPSFTSPGVRVGAAKQKQLFRAAQLFLSIYAEQIPQYSHSRFDVIAITLEPQIEIEHYPNAFIPLL